MSFERKEEDCGVRNAHKQSRWALLIGIDEYPNLPSRIQLSGCVNDIRLMSKILREKFGFPEDHVKTLCNQEATRDAILAEMDQVVSRVKLDDQVVFHYSGHGSRLRDQEGDEPDGFDETLVPYDSGRGSQSNREIINDEICSWLERLAAVTSYITLIFDCCHLGSIGAQAHWMERMSRAARSRQSAGQGISGSGRLFSEESYVLIAGCKSNESSYETWTEETRHGALTYLLAQELANIVPGTTYRDIFEKVAPQVTAMYPSQHPQLEGARDREIFGLRTIEPVAFVPVFERSGDQVTLGAGASCGLTAGSHWYVHPPGTKEVEDGEQLGKVTISKVGAVTSKATIVEESGPGTITVGARAMEWSHFTGATRLAVEVTAPTGQADVQELLSRLSQSRFLRLAEGRNIADARVYLLPPRFNAGEGAPVPALGALRELTWAVMGPHGHLLMLPRPYSDLEAVKAIVQNLENRTRFRQTLELENDRSALAGMVDLKVLRRLKDGLWGEPEMDVDGEPVLYDGDQFFLEITNRDTRPLYMYVLNLRTGGSVCQLYPVQGAQKPLAPALVPFLPAGRTFQVGSRSGEGMEMSMPEEILSSWHLLGMPSPEGRETMKLFAATQPADLKVLFQPEYLRSETNDSLTQTLIDIMAGGSRREVILSVPEDDWTTVQRSFRLKPKKSASTVCR